MKKKDKKKERNIKGGYRKRSKKNEYPYIRKDENCTIKREDKGRKQKLIK